MLTLKLAGDDQHWQVDLQEARRLYQLKIWNATAYLLAILKIHGKEGWKWNIRVADFCAESGIPERSLYRAMSELRLRGLADWQLRGRIVIWWGNTQESTQKLSPVSVPPLVAETLPTMAETLPTMAETLPTMAETKSEPLNQQGVGDSLRLSSDLISNPPQSEEERNFSEKEEEGAAQDEEVRGGSVQDVITLFDDIGESPQILSPENKLSSKEEEQQEDVDEDVYLRWVVDCHLPTTQDYQQGKIRDLRRYALKCIDNDGTGALKKQFIQSLKDSEHQAKCQELEQRVADRRREWEAAGERLSVYSNDSGFPVVVHQGIFIDAGDFLNMLIPSPGEFGDRPKELPAAALVGKQILLARQELNKIQSRIKAKTFQPSRNWADKLISWWEHESLRGQIKQIIKDCSELGLIVEDGSLLFDF